MTSLSPNEIRKKGFEALFESLGPSGMLKFLEQFDMGLGNYTEERKQWLKDQDIDTIIKEIEKQRES